MSTLQFYSMIIFQVASHTQMALILLTTEQRRESNLVFEGSGPSLPGGALCLPWCWRGLAAQPRPCRLVLLRVRTPPAWRGPAGWPGRLGSCGCQVQWEAV